LNRYNHAFLLLFSYFSVAITLLRKKPPKKKIEKTGGIKLIQRFNHSKIQGRAAETTPLPLFMLRAAWFCAWLPVRAFISYL
jgi:hypothetical protein